MQNQFHLFQVLDKYNTYEYYPINSYNDLYVFKEIQEH